jgi:predicted RNA-binding Zn ribbon-like protein
VESSRAGTLALLGGIPALDFANTTSNRDSDRHVEHLQTAANVFDWASHAGVFDVRAAQRARAAVSRDAETARRLLSQALKLRDAIYRVGSAIAHHEEPERSELEVIKSLAGKAMRAGDFARRSDDGYVLDFSRAPYEVAVLGPVAWSAVTMLKAGNFERIKQCPAPDCGWLFFDRSKNNSRQWCDMAVCGNRAKVRRHREGRAR